jgi:hypothetical protein
MTPIGAPRRARSKGFKQRESWFMDPRQRPTSVPNHILREWGVANAIRLPGGQGSAFGAGELVLKPVINEREATFVAKALSSLLETDSRLSPTRRFVDATTGSHIGRLKRCPRRCGPARGVDGSW